PRSARRPGAARRLLTRALYGAHDDDDRVHRALVHGPPVLRPDPGHGWLRWSRQVASAPLARTVTEGRHNDDDPLARAIQGRVRCRSGPIAVTPWMSRSSGTPEKLRRAWFGCCSTGKKVAPGT